MSEPVTELRAPHVTGAQAALALRLELEIGFSPISGPHLWELIRERGVDLAFHRFGPNMGDGLYLWNGKRGLIVLNASKMVLRLRFTAVHELGHHEMHRHTLERVVLSDKDVLAQGDSVEQEANAFAAEFLAPSTALRRELAGQTPPLESLDVVRLMRVYGLSYPALLWRLKDVGAISAAHQEDLAAVPPGEIRQLKNALGFDERKLFGPPTNFLPEEFQLSAAQLFNSGALDTRRLATLLRLSEDEAMKWAKNVSPEPVATSEIDALLDGVGSTGSKR